MKFPLQLARSVFVKNFTKLPETMCRTPIISQTRRLGFTLIELLVVIAIIGLLATIGSYGLGKAREASQSAKCVSNLRSIYTAMILQAQDNDLKIVNNQEQYGTTWVNTIRLYTGLKAYGTGANQTPVASATGKRPDTVWACPASKRTVTTSEHTWSDYGKNWCINPALAGTSGAYSTPIYKLPAINNPGQVIFAGDAEQRDINPWGSSPLKARHGGRANVIYYDGHAASVKPGDLPTDGNKPPWRPVN